MMLPDLKEIEELLHSQQFTVANINASFKSLNASVSKCSEDIPCMMDEDKELIISWLDKFLSCSVKIIAVKMMEAFKIDDSRSYNHEVFTIPLSHVSSVLLRVTHFIPSACNSTSQFNTCCCPAIVQLYLIFGPGSIWPCTTKRNHVESLLKTSLDIVQQPNLKVYLNWISNSLYAKILQQFTPFLTREKWKQHPPLAYGYKNLICSSEREKLSESISIILPPVLLLVDDFESDYVLLGLKIMNRVLFEVPSAEFRMYGWADVLYDALSKKVYHRDADMLDQCLPCLLSVMKILERDPKKVDKSRALTRYDDVLQIFISNLTMCTDTNIVRVHWKHMTPFINMMDITVLRHLKDLLQLLEYHLDIGNLTHLPHIFQTIEAIICTAWVRFHHHTGALLKLLLKLGLRLSLNSCDDEGHYKNIRRCVSLLYHCNNTVVQETLEKLNQLPEWQEHHLRELTKIEKVVIRSELQSEKIG